jgi:hypothetical protein
MQHGSCFQFSRALTMSAAPLPWLSLPAVAGPPFQTADPGTPYQCCDIHLASDYPHTPGSVDGTLPDVDINYGTLPYAALTVTVPIAQEQEPGAPLHFGYGDTASLERSKQSTISTRYFFRLAVRSAAQVLSRVTPRASFSSDRTRERMLAANTLSRKSRGFAPNDARRYFARTEHESSRLSCGKGPTYRWTRDQSSTSS